MNNTKKTKAEKPFFARFLSKQELQQATGGDPGGGAQTNKFPSDGDDDFPTGGDN